MHNDQVPLRTEIKHWQLECVERLNVEAQRPLSPCPLDNAFLQQLKNPMGAQSWASAKTFPLGHAVRVLYNQVRATSNEELPLRGYRRMLRGPFAPVVPLRR